MSERTNGIFINKTFEPRVVESIPLQTKSFMRNKPSDSKMSLPSGSTVPLVETPSTNDLESGGAEEEYVPAEHRTTEHPTSLRDTFMHLLKGSLGSGILAMPKAFYNAGLWGGLVLTVFVGAVCTYCIHVLVSVSQHVCRTKHRPALDYADTAELVFRSSKSEAVRRYCRFARCCVNVALVADLLGCCCVYILFISKSTKHILDGRAISPDMSLRYYMLALLLPLIAFNLVRNLKRLASLSTIANALIFVALAITFYYLLFVGQLPSPAERPAFADPRRLPAFFGTVIFALEGIGVVMPLENNMREPHRFLGWRGALNPGMTIVVALYTIMGFLGYLRFGDATADSITLNLPQDDVLALIVNGLIAAAIFLTYGLQFYVPVRIVCDIYNEYVKPTNEAAHEYAIRVLLVTMTVVIAVALPNLGPFITLIGALCLSTLGLMFPAVIQLVAFWDDPTKGWVFRWKNYALIAFGVVGLISGTMVSLNEFHEAA